MAKGRANAPKAMDAAAVWVDIYSLDPWDKNPRVNDGEPVDSVAMSLIEFGWGRPLVAREENRELLVGHTTRKAALSLKERWQAASQAQRKKWHADAVNTMQTGLVPVRFIGLNAHKAHLLALTDNRLGEKAEWDEPVLLEVMGDFSLQELNTAGWDEADLEELGADFLKGDAPPEGEGPSEDIAPDPPKIPVTRLGDIWMLGDDHLLICGDSTTQETVRALMRDELAPLIWTDPPYNLAGNNELHAKGVRKGYKDLKEAEWDQDFDITAAMARILEATAADATAYVCTSHHLAGAVWAWMKEWSDHDNWIPWVKPNPMPSLAKRHWTWANELICYATRGKHTFNFPDQGHALSWWQIPVARHGTGHPNEKPVKVPAHAISHSSERGDIVLDLFGGSGSTMSACAQLERRARLAELDPGWCDVIVDRYESLTGGKATRRSMA